MQNLRFFLFAVEKNMKLAFQMRGSPGGMGIGPLTLLMTSKQSGFLLRFFERFAETSVRRMAMFRAKKIYIQFRPIQKIKDQIRAKKMTDEARIQNMLARINSMFFQLNMIQLRVIPPAVQEDSSLNDGILEILGDVEVKLGWQNVTHKLYCSYPVEKVRFLHVIDIHFIKIKTFEEMSE